VSWWSWHLSDPYTVGIEEEVMLVDPASWALTQRAADVLSALGDDVSESCSAETHQAALELRTAVHGTVGAAVAELGELRARLARDVAKLGIAVATSGMHPGAVTEPMKVYPGERAELIDRTMRELAHREPTFALHIHVGITDAERAIRLVNRLRAHLPLLLGLSASSPFWRGRATGLASNRTILFQAFPRTGLPRDFSGYADWVKSVGVLVRSGAIPEPTFLWWDIRPQPRLGTVEVRIMDAQPRLRDIGALGALVQALARLELEQGFAEQALAGAQEVLSENRFLAARDGAAAELIDPARELRIPLSELLAEVLTAAAPHAAALGADAELARVAALASSPEADRQREVSASGGMPALVADLSAQFLAR
jgi:glutamate---cysteine ligase / carboxylate-amine ligase